MGGCCQRAHLNLILTTAQQGRSCYDLKFGGQESEARAAVWSRDLPAGSPTPGQCWQSLDTPPVQSTRRQVRRGEAAGTVWGRRWEKGQNRKAPEIREQSQESIITKPKPSQPAAQLRPCKTIPQLYSVQLFSILLSHWLNDPLNNFYALG